MKLVLHLAGKEGLIKALLEREAAGLEFKRSGEGDAEARERFETARDQLAQWAYIALEVVE